MKFVVARRNGTRGCGLGNEILTWAKGYIASEVLGARLIGPSWGLNSRKYYRNFGTSRLDFMLEDLLARLPHHEFTETDYRATGEVDFGRAIEIWAAKLRLDKKSSFIVTLGGMYGGYTAIAKAKPFIWAKLLNSRDTLSNIFSQTSQINSRKLTVAVHMRAGDFRALQEGENLRGQFNFRIPGRWYLDVCEALQQVFRDEIQFHFFADFGSPEVEEGIRRFNPGQKPGHGLTECSDLLLMAMADLRICSISSYSLVASFLSDGPYIWFEPQLTIEREFYSLWGYEERQREPESQTMRAIEEMALLGPETVLRGAVRGWPVSTDARVSPRLVEELRSRLVAKQGAGDLVHCGVVPAWAVGNLQGAESSVLDANESRVGQ